MGLSMHEQRVLADIEHRLAERDPSFVARFCSLQRVMCAPKAARARAVEPRQQRRGEHAMGIMLFLAAIMFLVALGVHRTLVLVVALLLAIASPLLKSVVDGRVHRHQRVPRR